MYCFTLKEMMSEVWKEQNFFFYVHWLNSHSHNFFRFPLKDFSS